MLLSEVSNRKTSIDRLQFELLLCRHFHLHFLLFNGPVSRCCVPHSALLLDDWLSRVCSFHLFRPCSHFDLMQKRKLWKPNWPCWSAVRRRINPSYPEGAQSIYCSIIHPFWNATVHSVMEWLLMERTGKKGLQPRSRFIGRIRRWLVEPYLCSLIKRLDHARVLLAIISLCFIEVAGQKSSTTVKGEAAASPTLIAVSRDRITASLRRFLAPVIGVVCNERKRSGSGAKTFFLPANSYICSELIWID